TELGSGLSMQVTTCIRREMQAFFYWGYQTKRSEAPEPAVLSLRALVLGRPYAMHNGSYDSASRLSSAKNGRDLGVCRFADRWNRHSNYWYRHPIFRSHADFAGEA